MTLTCPCCRASNNDSPCRRCKADLSLLFAWKRQAKQDAVAALKRRDFAAALAHYRAAK